MGDVTWAAYGTIDDLIATASFTSIATGSGVVLDPVDNSSAKKRFADLWVKFPSAVASSGTAARLDVYLIAAVDGTNYPDPPATTAANVPNSYKVGYISALKRGNTAVNFTSGVLRGIVIPPCPFKLILFNELGASTPSSGTFVIGTYRYGETVA